MRIYRVTVTLDDSREVIITVEAASRKQARRAARGWAADNDLDVVTAQATCVGQDEPVLTEASDEIEHAIQRLLEGADADMKRRIATLLGD